MKLNSIRVKTILILIPLVILPILLVGIAGTLFYRDVIRQNIWDDNLAQAKALSAYDGQPPELFDTVPEQPGQPAAGHQ